MRRAPRVFALSCTSDAAGLVTTTKAVQGGEAQAQQVAKISSSITEKVEVDAYFAMVDALAEARSGARLAADAAVPETAAVAVYGGIASAAAATAEAGAPVDHGPPVEGPEPLAVLESAAWVAAFDAAVQSSIDGIVADLLGSEDPTLMACIPDASRIRNVVT